MQAPKNAYWSADTAYSIRSTPYPAGGEGAPGAGDGEQRLVLIMGEKYRTGEVAAPPEDPLSRFRRLAAFAAGNFGMRRLTYRWATHDLMPPDGLPYIGKVR